MGSRGPAPGTGGRPKKPISEKIEEGNRGKRTLTVIDFSKAGIDGDGIEMPDVPEFFGDPQDTMMRQFPMPELEAGRIYKEAWEWLNERKCAHLVPRQQLEEYAMATARWVQAERMTSQKGIVCIDGRTQKLMKVAPWVAMADIYLTQSNKLWNEIFQLVKENCLTDYSGVTPQEDVMEQLLKKRKA